MNSTWYISYTLAILSKQHTRFFLPFPSALFIILYIFIFRGFEVLTVRVQAVEELKTS